MVERPSNKLVKKKILKQKKHKIKRKRCQTRNKIGNKNFRVYAINSAGIKSKLVSFESVLNNIQPSLWMLQETKLKPNEIISCASVNDFCVYYLNRQNTQGGGVALGVRKDIKSALITEGEDEIEAI